MKIILPITCLGKRGGKRELGAEGMRMWVEPANSEGVEECKQCRLTGIPGYQLVVFASEAGF